MLYVYQMLVLTNFEDAKCEGAKFWIYQMWKVLNAGGTKYWWCQMLEVTNAEGAKC